MARNATRLRCLGGPWHDQEVTIVGHAREVEVRGNRAGWYERWPDGPGEMPLALTWVTARERGGWERLAVRRP